MSPPRDFAGQVLRRVKVDDPKSTKQVPLADLRQLAGADAKGRRAGLERILGVLANGPRDAGTRASFRNSIRRLDAADRSRLAAVVQTLRQGLPPGEPQAAVAELLEYAQRAKDKPDEEP